MHSFILTQRIPWTAQALGLQSVGHDFHFHPWALSLVHLVFGIKPMVLLKGCTLKESVQPPESLLEGKEDKGNSVLQTPQFQLCYINFRPSHVALVLKNPPANAGGLRTTGLISGLGRSSGGGHGNPLHYSGKIPWKRSLMSFSPWGHKESP